MVQAQAAVAMVGVAYLYAVVHVQAQKYAAQQLGRVVDHNLLERMPLLGQVLDVVVAHAHEEDVAARDRIVHVAVVDVFRAAYDIAQRIARKSGQVYPAVVVLGVFHDRGVSRISLHIHTLSDVIPCCPYPAEGYIAKYNKISAVYI